MEQAAEQPQPLREEDKMLSVMAVRGWDGAERWFVTKHGTAGTTKPLPQQWHHERQQCTHGYQHLGGEREQQGEVTLTMSGVPPALRNPEMYRGC